MSTEAKADPVRAQFETWHIEYCSRRPELASRHGFGDDVKAWAAWQAALAQQAQTRGDHESACRKRINASGVFSTQVPEAPVQEAVAVVCQDRAGCKYLSWSVEWFHKAQELPPVGTKLYTTPQPAIPEAVGAAVDALSGKYGNVLAPFLCRMERELHANAGKGDRPGWLAMSADTALLEIYYHVAKLQKAVRNEGGDLIAEHAADVANMAMMLLDVCGGIDAQHNKEGE